MKRFFVICLVGLMILLVGCNDSKPSSTKKPTPNNVETQTSSDVEVNTGENSDSNVVSNNISSDSNSTSSDFSSVSSNFDNTASDLIDTSSDSNSTSLDLNSVSSNSSNTSLDSNDTSLDSNNVSSNLDDDTSSNSSDTSSDFSSTSSDLNNVSSNLDADNSSNSSDTSSDSSSTSSDLNNVSSNLDDTSSNSSNTLSDSSSTSSDSSSVSSNSSNTSSDSSSDDESYVTDEGIQEIIPTGNTANLMNPQVGGSDKQADTLRNKILNAKDSLKINGKKYYISPNGSLDNDGLSPETPWSTDALIVYGYEIKSGDAVLFERGKVYRIVSTIPLVSGVTYAAYGTGNKPAIYASEKNYAQDGLWYPSRKEYIWRLDFTAGEVGNIVFNHGESMGVVRDGLADLKETGEFYHNELEGYLYLYCDKGYPQDVYKDIEISAEVGIMSGSSLKDVTIDNLTFKYTGSHAINITNSKNITVTNCEFGWIGGCYMTEAGAVERYGNAIQFWDAAENITVKNNWAYQVYDAGLTFQSRSDVKYRNIKFTENLIEYCNYSIEFFVGEDQDNAKGEYTNITFSDNIMRFAGYGFGFNRNYVHGTAHIVGWQYAVPNTTNFKIQNNIFDCSARVLAYWTWKPEQNQPGLIISGNTFYQKKVNFPLPENYISGYIEYAAMSFGVNESNFITAKNQKELELAVKKFDKSPKAVKWLDK